MSLIVPSHMFGKQLKEFQILVDEFNTIPEDDHVQRLFLLQKINYRINTLPLNDTLFAWLNENGNDSWNANLNSYSINPVASFFLKGIQFAKAVAKHTEDKQTILSEKDIYLPMQERDKLLKGSFNSSKENYIKISHQLKSIAETKQVHKESIEHHSHVLDMAKFKIEAIQGVKVPKTEIPRPSYHTKVLGKPVNNFNYQLNISGWDKPFVLRVEDRDGLELEQELHSLPVSRYFIEEFALFRMAFKNTNQLKPEYRPVVLSQYANENNLAALAVQLGKNLRENKVKLRDIGPTIVHYFTQLNDFCLKLMEAGIYHPDIKLTNFLIHNKHIRVSDRKTFTKQENPIAGTLRITPEYAPDELIACLNDSWTDYNEAIANEKVVNMPAVMAYQLGMALKEFLILTQLEKRPPEFRDPDRSAASYFQSPNQHITNLSLCVQELTRVNPAQRLSIKQFQKLLRWINHSPEGFYKILENELPSASLGIQNDLDILENLIRGKITGGELITQANLVFNTLSASFPKETRLIRQAEKLAIKCYKSYAESFFVQSIHQELLNKDWDKAIWYRKILHVVTFGLFRVEEVTAVEEIKETMGIDVASQDFQNCFPLLEFLPIEQLNSLGASEAECFKDFICNYWQINKSNNPDEPKNDVISVPNLEDSIPLDALLETPLPAAPENKEARSETLLEETEAIENSLSDSTLLSKDEVEQPNLVVRFGDFFLNNTPKSTPNRPGQSNSINSSVLRGDGSTDRKKSIREPDRTHVADIDWTPPNLNG